MTASLAYWTEENISVWYEPIGTSVQKLREQEVWGSFPEKSHSSNPRQCWRPLNPECWCPLIFGATLQSWVTYFLSFSFHFLVKEYSSMGMSSLKLLKYVLFFFNLLFWVSVSLLSVAELASSQLHSTSVLYQRSLCGVQFMYARVVCSIPSPKKEENYPFLPSSHPATV